MNNTITNSKELEVVLSKLLLNDTKCIQQAEEQVGKFSENPICVPALYQLIQRGTQVSTGIRHLAAIVLKQNLPKHWKKIDESTANFLKGSILQTMLKEPQPLVRNSILEIISQIAHYEVPLGRWEDLTKVFELIRSRDVCHREACVTLGGYLFETIGNEMRRNLQQFLGLISAGLSDSAVSVQMATLRTLVTMNENLDSESEVELTMKLIPTVLQLLTSYMEKDEDEPIGFCFDFFLSFLELNIHSIDFYIPGLFKYMVQVAGDVRLDKSYRLSALEYLAALVKRKTRLVVHQAFMEKLLHLVFECLKEPDDGDPQGLSEEVSLFHIASFLLDTIALHIPSKYIYKPIMEHSVTLANSSNSWEKKAGIAAIGILSDGCRNVMSRNIQQLLPLIINNGLNDEKAKLVTTYTLHAVCDHLGEAMAGYQQEIFPIVFQLLQDPNITIRELSVQILDSMCSQVGRKVVPFTEKFIYLAMNMLNHPRDPKDLELAINIISCVVYASGAMVLQYSDRLIPVVNELMVKSNDPKLRSISLECLANIGISIGSSHFDSNRYLQSLVFDPEQAKRFEKDYLFAFFEDMLSLMQDKFERKFVLPILEMLMQSINEEVVVAVSNGSLDKNSFFPQNIVSPLVKNYSSSTPSEAITTTAHTSGNGNGNNNAAVGNNKNNGGIKVWKIKRKKDLLGKHTLKNTNNNNSSNNNNNEASVEIDAKDDDEDEEEEEDDDNEDDGNETPINIQLVHEKASAMAALHRMLEFCPDSIPEQWQQPIRDAIIAHLIFNHEEVRRNCVVVLKHFKPSDEIITILSTAMVEDDDKETVSNICECIEAWAEKKWIPKDSLVCLSNALNILLDKAGNCNFQELEDDSHDFILADNICEAVTALAQSFGPSFEPFYRKIFVTLMKYLREDLSEEDKFMAVGCMAEVGNAIQQEIRYYIDRMIQPVMTFAGFRQHSNLQRNALFCLGIMSQWGPKDQMGKYIRSVLQLLYPILLQKENEAKFTDVVVDNACACLARVTLIYHKEQILPMEEILNTLLSHLPLRSDVSENETIFSCLLMLLKNGEKTTQNLALKIKSLIPQNGGISKELLAEYNKFYNPI